MSEATKGPWQIYERKDDYYKILAETPHMGNAHVAEVLHEANARLICAAPTLRDALRECADFLDQHFGHADAPHHPDALHALAEARAALALTEAK